MEQIAAVTAFRVRMIRYDILRALDYLQSVNAVYDPCMEDALMIILKKQRADGRWNLQAHHPGQVHFQMEEAGQPSRWNTLRALRVLKHFDRYDLKRR